MNEPTAAEPDVSPPDDPWRWVSVPKAATLLGCSQPTILRRIRDGRPIALPDGSKLVLSGERIERPQGSLFQVRLPSELVEPKPEEPSAVPDDVSVPPINEVPDVSPEPEVPSPFDLERMMPVLNLIVAPYVERERERDAQLARRSELIGELQSRLSVLAEQTQLQLRAKEGELGALRQSLAMNQELTDELRQFLALERATSALAESRVGDLTQALADLGEEARARQGSWWRRLMMRLGLQWDVALER